MYVFTPGNETFNWSTVLFSLQAKDCGQLENKWLMINIQNVQDFACQCLNRDVWSNDAVKTIIREHFIFWQVTFLGPLLLVPSDIVSVSCTQLHCCSTISWDNPTGPLTQAHWNHFTFLVQRRICLCPNKHASMFLPGSHISVLMVF